MQAIDDPPIVGEIVRLVSASEQALSIHTELAFMSPVLKSALQLNMMESKRNIIYLPEISECALREVIRYIKSDFDISTNMKQEYFPDPTLSIETMMAGVYLDLPRLVHKCCLCISKNFDDMPPLALEYVPDELARKIITGLNPWELRYAETEALCDRRKRSFGADIAAKWKDLYLQDKHGGSDAGGSGNLENDSDAWKTQRKWCLQHYLEKITRAANNKRQFEACTNLGEYKRRVKYIGPLLSEYNLRSECLKIDADTLEFLLYSLRNASKIDLSSNRLTPEVALRIPRALRPCSVECYCPDDAMSEKSERGKQCQWKGAWIAGLDVSGTGISLLSVESLCTAILNQSKWVAWQQSRSPPRKEKRSGAKKLIIRPPVPIKKMTHARKKTVLKGQTFKPALPAKKRVTLKGKTISPRAPTKQATSLKGHPISLLPQTKMLAVNPGRMKHTDVMMRFNSKVAASPKRPKPSPRRAQQSFRQTKGVSSFRSHKIICSGMQSTGHRAPTSSVQVATVGFTRQAKPQVTAAKSLTKRPCTLRAAMSGRKPLFLSIARNFTGDQPVMEIADGMTASGGYLLSLKLAGNYLGDDGAEVLAKMFTTDGRRNALTHLDVSGCKLGRHGMAVLVHAISNSSMISLNLADNLSVHANQVVVGITDRVGHAFTRLLSAREPGGGGAVPSLTRLNVSENAFAINEIGGIVDAMAFNYTLTSLDISSMHAAGNMSRVLAYCLMTNRHTGLRRLNMSNNFFIERLLDDYASLCSHNFVCLTSLDISGNCIDDETAKRLGRALSVPACKLKELKLDALYDRHNHLHCAGSITCDGFICLINGIRKAGSFSKLTKLSLRYHCVRSTGATHLASVLPHALGLQRIDLRNNKITESGAVAIAYLLEQRGRERSTDVGTGNRRGKKLDIKLQGNPIGEAVQKVLF
jgi:Ran GTPase-activating protein (RanGAP) involved in mRNA processing and transport